MACHLHRVSKKTKQICFYQNCIKFPPILIIFGRKMANDTNICEVHSFSTSTNLRHHLTVLNANVPNSTCTDTGAADTWLHTSDTVATEFARPQSGQLQRLECSAGESLSLQDCWHRWTQNVSRQRVGAVRPVDHWRHDQPVAPPSERLCGAHFEHKFWQQELIILLNKAPFVYCALIKSLKVYCR